MHNLKHYCRAPDGSIILRHLGSGCMFPAMHWMTREERRSLGQSRRKQVGRQEHSQLNAKARRTPALKLLQQAGKGRVPALLQLKYQLMSESPFGYFRGAA